MAISLRLHLKTITAQGALVMLVARDEAGRRYTVQVTDFKPYFFVEDTPENRVTLKKRGLPNNVPGRPSLFGTPTLRVEVDTPASVPKRRKGFERTFEADVPYTRRFLVDLGIHDGFEVSGDYRILGDLMRPGDAMILATVANLKPISLRTPDRQMLYDIETNKPEGSKHYSSALEALGAVTAVSYHDSFDAAKVYTLWWHPERGTVGRPREEIRSQWSDTHEREIPWIVRTYGSEEEMLVALLQYLKKERPDVMQAWNGHHGHHRMNRGGFDAPYLISRLRRIGISPGQLSPLGNVFAGYRAFGKEASAKAAGAGKFQCNIDGIQLVDGMTVMQIKEGGFTAQVPFSDLKRVTEKFTKKKVKKDPSAIEEWWLHNSEQFLTYSFNDVDALMILEQTQGYLDFARDMQQFVGAEDANRLFTPMSLITTMLLRIAQEENVCVPTSDSDNEDYEAEGGYVLDPQVRGVQRRIGVLDLTTMYVHIILSGNLSPETHVPNPTEEQMKDLICVPSDLGPQFFLKPSTKVGMLPKVCQRFRAVRQRYDDLIATAKSAEEVKKLKHQRQPAKQLLLGVWGTSLSKFFCLFKAEVGSSITGTGRFIIQETRDFVRHLGDEVVYVDTDSNFVPLPAEDPVGHGEWLADRINENFDVLADQMNMDTHGFEIGLESIYDPFVMGDTKKMYAGNIVWSEGKWQVDKDGKPAPVFMAAGVSGIKSDAAPITKECSLAILKAILAGVPPLELLDYVQTMHDGVLSGEVPLEDIIKATTLNQDADDPKATTHIVKAVRHGKATYDFEYQIGSKVRIVKLRNSEAEWVAIPEDEELPDDLRIDMLHHAEITILRPLQNLLNWVDLSVESIRHGTVVTVQKRF